MGTELQPVVGGQLASWSLEPSSEASAQVFFKSTLQLINPHNNPIK